jgi:hypothetical protein
MNNFELQAAYRLGQQAAMEKVAGAPEDGLTYSPQYSPEQLHGIRGYNLDVASGVSNWSALAGALQGGLRGYNRGGGLGALAGALGGGALGKGIGYGVARLGQGLNNYIDTDVNAQAARYGI